VFDLLVVVTRCHIDEACASFIVCIRRYVFCLIVQFSKFVVSFSATLIRYHGIAYASTVFFSFFSSRQWRVPVDMY